MTRRAFYFSRLGAVRGYLPESLPKVSGAALVRRPPADVNKAGNALHVSRGLVSNVHLGDIEDQGKLSSKTM